MADKIILLALCGAADRPADGPTPLDQARLPHLDALSVRGALGTLTVIDSDIPPESDSGALALLGYEPIEHYTGRGPLEGFGNGFLRPRADVSTVCFRLNMASYDAGTQRFDRRTARDLSDVELQGLLDEVRTGVSLADHDAGFEVMGFGRHRGVLALHSATRKLSGNVTNTDPEYDRVGAFGVPRRHHGDGPVRCCPLDFSTASRDTANLVEIFLARSASVLAASEINRTRLANGKLAANQIIVRDGGDRLPELRPFRELHGRTLTLYGQVPAERGLARLMDAAWVDCRRAAEMNETTYYADLAEAVAKDSADVVYVHVKGADEAAHDRDFDGKVTALERVDQLLIAELLPRMRPVDTLLVTGDHATPWRAGIHTADPVPVLAVGGGVEPDGCTSFTETAARAGSLGHRRACELLSTVTAYRAGR
ncbi:MAG: CMP-5'-phosphonoformate--3-phosphoglycerate phosphonoformyl transferase [Pseudonocardiaceae bacterium]